MRNGPMIGLLLILVFVISQGIRDVYLTSAFGQLGFFDIVFIAFSGTTILYSGLLKMLAPEQFSLLKKHWRRVIAINVTTAGGWLGYFGALTFIEPSVVNTLFSGVAPVSVVLLAYLGFQATGNKSTSKIERGLHYGILAVLVMISTIVLTGLSGFGEISLTSGLIGIGFAAAGGFLITAETVYAKQMNDVGISAIGVLAFRFVMITGIALVAIVFFDQTSLPDMQGSAILDVSGKLMLLIALPLLLVQKGLALTSPTTTSVVIAFGPSIVFIIQAIEGSIPSSGWVLMAALLYAALTIISVLVRASKSSEPVDIGTPERQTTN